MILIPPNPSLSDFNIFLSTSIPSFPNFRIRFLIEKYKIDEILTINNIKTNDNLKFIINKPLIKKNIKKISLIKFIIEKIYKDAEFVTESIIFINSAGFLLL